jgi:pSer/pThr/pTyr-binding forkhead associated (FHA) protein
MKIQLLVLNKSGVAVSSFEQDHILIGRSSVSDLKIKDRFVSRKHLIIQRRSPTHYLLTNLSNRDQTFLNSERLNPFQTVPLKSGDKIKIGLTVIEFTIVAEGAENKLALLFPPTSQCKTD